MGERYYVQTTINRTVGAILKGDDRVLITMGDELGKP
jgi:type I site-specific restriction endonuclease